MDRLANHFLNYLFENYQDSLHVRRVIAGPVIRSMPTAIKPLNGSSQSRYCPNSRAKIDIRHTGKKFNAMPKRRKNCGKIFVME